MSNVFPFRGRDPDHPGPELELDAESIAAGYAMLFEPTMRAAQIACLGFAQITRDDRWPEPEMVCGFARLYHVPAADLGAFFGLLSYQHGGRTIWVDTMRGPVSRYAALDRLSPAQRMAFGFLGLTADVIEAERRAVNV